MTVIVSDAGFGAESFPGPIVALADMPDMPANTQGVALEVPNDVDVETVLPWLKQAAMIRIPFPSFGDGRGFSLARQLRMRGYGGVLRAVGPLIADQYRAARRVGFDEVEIPDDLAARQPQAQWPLGQTDAGLGYQRKFQTAQAAS